MTITKLKAKNQLTIPREIVKQMKLRPDELFSIQIEDNYIKLVPVDIEPRYSAEALAGIDKVVEKEKAQGESLKPGEEFSARIQKLTK